MLPVVEVAGIRVARGGRTVLDVPALDVRQGEILAVIGPNGAGKSTLLRVLGLLEAPAAGTLRFRGAPVTARDGLALRRRMASVFQEPLLADATVHDNVALGLTFRGVDGRRIGPRVQVWLERFGISPLASRQARTLSGGEAQRVAVARALVPSPSLLLADEPSGNLDAAAAERLHSILSSLARDRHQTVVLVTHNDRLAAMADRVLRLESGRLAAV